MGPIGPSHGRHSRRGRGDAGGIDKGSGTIAWVTGGCKVGAVPEEGAVGASKNMSLGAGAWDGGGRFSWQGGAGVDGMMSVVPEVSARWMG